MLGVDNRTSVDNILDECGFHSRSQICNITHTVCMTDLMDSEWRCRCAAGYVRLGSGCEPIPTSLLESNEREVHRTVNVNVDEINPTVLSLPYIQYGFLGASNLTCSVEAQDEFTCNVNDTEITVNMNTNSVMQTYYEFSITIGAVIDSTKILDRRTVKILAVRQVISAFSVISTEAAVGQLVAHIPLSSPNLTLNSSYFEINSRGDLHLAEDLDNVLDNSFLSRILTLEIKINGSIPGALLQIMVYRSNLEVSVPENTIRSFVRISASNEVSYNMSYQNPEIDDIFEILDNELKIVEELDYEYVEHRSFEFEIVFHRGNDTIAMTNIKVGITDENDNAPKFPFESYEVNVAQGVRETFIMNLFADDEDTVGTVMYNLASGNARFQIRSDTELWMTSALNSSDVTISVTDEENIEDTLTVSVTVEAYKEENLNRVYNVIMYEEQPSGYFVDNVYDAKYDDYQFNEQRASEYFHLHDETGNITTAKRIDRDTDPYILEANNVLSFTIRANRRGFTCSFVIIGRLTVTLLDINDNAPESDRSVYHGSIVEESAVNTSMQLNTTVLITDKDLNTNLTYSLSSTYFMLESDSSDANLLVIKSTRRLDRETFLTSVKEIYLAISDGYNSTTVSIFVTVLDINDNWPKYQSANYGFSIVENARARTVVAQLNYTDEDQGDNSKLYYSLDSSHFFVNESGALQVDLPPDRETDDVHNITIVVCDGGQPALCTRDNFTINILDENDNVPVFVSPSNIIFVSESVSCDPSHDIVRVVFSDSDMGENGRISYEVMRPKETFIIQSDTGLLYCNGTLNYEALIEPRFEVEVQACDHGNERKCSVANVYIEITDVNDNSPVFAGEYENRNVHISINEAYFSAVTPISLVSATDDDSGSNGQLSFALSLLGGSNFLSINSENGLISTKILDMSHRPMADDSVVYRATVTVSDNGLPRRTNTANLTLAVIAVSDNFTFSDTDFSRSVTEGLINGDEVIRMREYFSGNDAVKYDIPGITGYKQFSLAVNESTGSVTITGNVDREKTVGFIFPVRATWARSAAIAIINVSISDINDNPPKFLPGRRVYRMFENETIGFLIGNLNAVDIDEVQNAQTIYSLNAHGGSADFCTISFGINETNGDIFLRANVDFDELHNTQVDTFCHFTAEAIDKGNTLFSDAVNISIEVLDVNDNPPEFLGTTYVIHIQEDVTVANEALLPFTVVDKDRKQSANGHVDLAVENADTCPFRIVGRRSTGNEQRMFFVLQNSKLLDYESITAYNCDIRATDKGSPSRSASVSVMVHIVDVNDNPPVVAEGTSKNLLNISRFSVIGEAVLSEINATDLDSGPNGEIEFLKNTDLSSEKAWNFFNLSETTGNIQVEKSLTNLQLDAVTLCVTVQDKGSPPLSINLLLSLTIEDTNVRPYFVVKTTKVSLVEETQYLDIPLYPPIQALDQGNELTKCDCLYRLETFSDIFEIDNKTATVRLRNNVTIDREEIQTIELHVIGQDNGIPPQDNSHDPLVVHVIISDINDMAPRFIQLQYNSTIFQSYPVNTPILTVTANDEDENPITVYEIVRFNMSTDQAVNLTTSVIDVNATSGEIFLNESIDINSTKDFQIEVVVRAFDRERPSFTDEVMVIITVQYQDPNQHHPSFINEVFGVTVSMDEIQTGDHVITLKASDNDVGINGEVTYAIRNGNIRDTFIINSTTGALSVQYLIDEWTDKVNGLDPIVLTIMAVDGGVVPKSNYTIVTITLTGSPQPCNGSTSQQVNTTPSPGKEDIPYIASLFVLIAVACLLMVTNTIFVVLSCRKQSLPDNDNRSEYINPKWKTVKRIHSRSYSDGSNTNPPYSYGYMHHIVEDFGGQQPYSSPYKRFRKESFNMPADVIGEERRISPYRNQQQFYFPVRQMSLPTDDFVLPSREPGRTRTRDKVPPSREPGRSRTRDKAEDRSTPDPAVWINRSRAAGVTENGNSESQSPWNPEVQHPEPAIDYPSEQDSPALPPRQRSRAIHSTGELNFSQHDRRRNAQLSVSQKYDSSEI